MNNFDECKKCGLVGDLEGHECDPPVLMTLREFLAVEVMGWHKTVFEPTHADRAGPEDYWMQGYRVRDWRPDELIEQAIMCAEKGYGWMIISNEGNCRANVFMEKGTPTNPTFGATGTGETPATALSLAVARAAGWKDE